jgi:hypothetical protein
MDKTTRKFWSELLDEEENLEEPNVQQIFVPVNKNIVSKVKTETITKTDVMKVSKNDKIVSNEKESEGYVNVKDQLEDEEDEETRLQKELDIFEHEWVRELKQEQLNENERRETTVTYASCVLKQGKNNEMKEMCDVASDKDDIPTKVRSAKIKLETYFCEHTKELDIDEQIKNGRNDKCSEVAYRDEECIEKEKNSLYLQEEEEELQRSELEVNMCRTESANLNNIKEEGYRKRGRYWHDNPEKILNRYAY